jgi:hypothetical protein
VSGQPIKNGTLLVGGPTKLCNKTIDTYTTALPTTGTIISKYDTKFDDPRYYTGDTAE